MKLRQVCYDCVGREDCEKSTEANWRDCRGKSYMPRPNKKLAKALIKNSVEV